MLKKQLKLPNARGNFSFLVDFKNAAPAKGAIFVIRPQNDGKKPGFEAKSSLSWSKAAQGFFVYSPELAKGKRITSKSFSIDFPSSTVEIEIVPWADSEVEAKVSGFMLVSEPTADDQKYTTFIGEFNERD